MAGRYGWKGYLKLSLVSVPVKSFSAVNSQDGEIHFHQLHEKCHSRIKYVKTCPIHGAVPQSEIVSGYEYSKGEYVVVEPGELDRLRSEDEKSVNVEAVVPESAIDARFLTDHISYLVPDGPVGQKPYALMAQCLTERQSMAIARWVKNGKDEVVAIRALDGLLIMTVLNSTEQVNSPQSYAAELPKGAVTSAELKLTNTLFDAFQQDKIDLIEFKNHYTERVAELIQAKIKGKEVVSPAASRPPEVINLMDALKKSVAFAKSSHVRKESLTAVKKPAKGNRLNSPGRRNSKTA